MAKRTSAKHQARAQDKPQSASDRPKGAIRLVDARGKLASRTTSGIQAGLPSAQTWPGRALAVAILEKQGYRVVVAHNGREALAALDRSPEPFDLVLMDAQMPELGGLETTALIREREKSAGRHIPIVAMTAHALKGDRERCLEAGMDAYLAKPIQPERLRKMADEMVSTSDGENRRDDEGAKPGQVLDGRALLAQVDGDVRLLAKLTRLFLADSPARLSSIRQAIASQNAEALRRAAHAFKGSIANFAARGSFEAAVALEAMGRRNDLTGAEKAYLTLKKEVARLERALAVVGARRTRKSPTKGQKRGAAKGRLSHAPRAPSGLKGRK